MFRSIAFTAAAISIVALTGCGSTGGSSASSATSTPTAALQAVSTPTTTPLPAPVPPPAGFPAGTYTGVLASDGGTPGTLTLSADGTYHIKGSTSSSIDITGVYTVSGSAITFLETVGSICSNVGSYTWQISGTTLKFTVVKDTCAGGARGNDFAEHPWVRQP